MNKKRTIKRTNPYSGESELLTEIEADIHDKVKLAEAQENYTYMHKTLKTQTNSVFVS